MLQEKPACGRILWIKRLIEVVRRGCKQANFSYISAVSAYEEWLQQQEILPSRLISVGVFQGRQDVAGKCLPDTYKTIGSLNKGEVSHAFGTRASQHY
jgi:hypothetical protein